MAVRKRFDPYTTLVPVGILFLLFYLFLKHPQRSIDILLGLRNALGHYFGFYYTLLGLGLFCLSLYLAFSSYGQLKLGSCQEPKYSNLTWGMMVFTSTMGADILYWSLTEWIHYANEPHVQKLGPVDRWAPTYPLFHWGPIPWSFYLIMAVIFGFQIHVRGLTRQRFSETCRPLLGNKTQGFLGKTVDLVAVLGLLAGATTTFTLVIPLLARIVGEFFRLPITNTLNLAVLLFIALLFLLMVYLGFQGISKLAKLASQLFILLLLYVFLASGEALFILETGIQSLGNLIQNFWTLATWLDPLRETDFTQKWTIFYWSYWLVWCVAIPFFIALISEGRTIRTTILGGYAFGLLGTFSSFIVFGNYGLALQLRGKLDLINSLSEGVTPQELVLGIFQKLPGGDFGLVLLALTLLAFYTTIFDALTMVLSFYTYQERQINEEPQRGVRLFWSVLFLLMPIALLISDSTLFSLQSIAIISAFPVGLVVLLAVMSFFKELKRTPPH